MTAAPAATAAGRPGLATRWTARRGLPCASTRVTPSPNSNRMRLWAWACHAGRAPQVGDVNADHSAWGRAEDMTMARPSYSVDPGKPGAPPPRRPAP